MVEEGGKRCHGDASAYVFCAGASVRLIQLLKFSFIFCLKVHQAIAAKMESMPLRTGQIELHRWNKDRAMCQFQKSNWFCLVVVSSCGFSFPITFASSKILNLCQRVFKPVCTRQWHLPRSSDDAIRLCQQYFSFVLSLGRKTFLLTETGLAFQPKIWVMVGAYK